VLKSKEIMDHSVCGQKVAGSIWVAKEVDGICGKVIGLDSAAKKFNRIAKEGHIYGAVRHLKCG
jgi:hypothetical protein